VEIVSPLNASGGSAEKSLGQYLDSAMRSCAPGDERAPSDHSNAMGGALEGDACLGGVIEGWSQGQPLPLEKEGALPHEKEAPLHSGRAKKPGFHRSGRRNVSLRCFP